MQRHADGDALQDPLLGYGDPYGGQDPPDVHASDRAAPPAESIASKTASAFPPPLPPLLQHLKLYQNMHVSHFANDVSLSVQYQGTKTL